MIPTDSIQAAFHAAQAGDAGALKSLLELHPALANTENEQGLTPLGYAAHFGNAEAVRVLLAAGADVNALSHSKVPYIPSNTALHAAIAGERSLEVVRLLLDRGARSDILDSSGHTALHTAAFHDDNVELIQLLIQHGADPSVRSEDGGTPLEIALRQGNHRVAELLQAHPGA